MIFRQRGKEIVNSMLKDQKMSREWEIIRLIGITLVVSRIIMFLVYKLSTLDLALPGFVGAYNTVDSVWYEGYVNSILNHDFICGGEIRNNGMAQWAFFPLYPLIVAAVCKITLGRISILKIGMLVSTVFFAGALYYGYKYIMLTRKNEKIAKSYIFIMTMGMYSFYFSILYTEALFLLLLTLCFYFLEKKQFLRMGVAGAFLSATRNVGVFFVFIVLVKCIMDYCEEHGRFELKGFIIGCLRDHRLVLGVSLVPVGFFAYVLYLIYKLGDGLAFMHVEIAWRITGAAGIFTYIKTSFWDVFPPKYLGAMFFVTVILIIFIFRNRHYHEAVLPILILLVSTPTGFYSIPRYMISTLAVPLAVSEELYELKPYQRKIAYIAMLLMEILLLRAWMYESDLLY